jgi:hypothetical protein
VPSSNPDDISNPFFVQFYRRNRRSALKREDHRGSTVFDLTAAGLVPAA